MDQTSFFRLFLLGGGRAGAGLAHYLSKAGHTIISLVEPDVDRRSFLQKKLRWTFVRQEISDKELELAEIVLLCVPDSQITLAAEELAKRSVNWPAKIVGHLSGSLSASSLSPLQIRGAATAAVHPVYSFAISPAENQDIHSALFNVQGDDSAYKRFQQIFRQAGNPVLLVNPIQKIALHLASVFFANFVVALAEQSQHIVSVEFPDIPDLFNQMHPLLLSTTRQIKKHGPRASLTGPVGRGDLATIRTHLEFLKNHFPELLSSYLAHSKYLISISGLALSDQKKLKKLLNEYATS